MLITDDALLCTCEFKLFEISLIELILQPLSQQLLLPIVCEIDGETVWSSVLHIMFDLGESDIQKIREFWRSLEMLLGV